MNNQLDDYKLSSGQVAKILGISQKYFQNRWRQMDGLPKPKPMNKRSLAWSISEIDEYKVSRVA